MVRFSTDTVLLVLDTSAAAFYAVVAIWAAVSTRHWFFRASVVATVLLAVLMIPAYELLIRFTCLELVVLGGITVWKYRWRSERLGTNVGIHRPRLSLTSIFLLIALVAVVSAVAARFESLTFRQWSYQVSLGMVAGATCLLGIWLAFGDSPWLRRISIAGACAIPLATVPSFFWSVYETILVGGPRRSTWNLAISWWPYWLTTTSVSIVGIWLVLYSGRAAGWFVRSSVDSHDRANSLIVRFTARVLFLALLAFVLVLPLYVFARLVFRPSIPLARPPSPNAYDHIIEVGAMLELPQNFIPQTADEATLRRTARNWRTALARLEPGLHQQCAVPVDYRRGKVYDPFPPRLWNVVKALLAELRLATFDERGTDATTHLIDLARLEQQLTRGGTSDEFKGASAILQVVEFSSVWRLLAEKDCRRLVAELQDIDHEMEPLAEVERRTYVRRANGSGWNSRARQIVNELAGDLREIEQFRSTYRRRQATIRRWIVAAAVRAYCLERGELPEKLAGLVPDYLEAVPSNPFEPERREIVYETVGERTFRLWIAGDAPSREERLFSVRIAEAVEGTNATMELRASRD